MHSGLQLGGAPMYPARQEQTACPFCGRHWLFGPQGDGWQGSWGCCGNSENNFIVRLSLQFFMPFRKNSHWNIPWGSGLQLEKGSPVSPSGQEQTGIWLTTSQRALCPQVPGHGSRHLLLIQAWFLGHSSLRIHSGRQFSYGLPIYSGKHWHSPLPRHTALGPHGDGLHGSVLSGLGVARSRKSKMLRHVFREIEILVLIRKILTYWNQSALCEWISRISFVARANRHVIQNVASGISAARTRAGIATFLVDASQLTSTFSTDNALRSTVRRSPNEVRQARASSLTAN